MSKDIVQAVDRRIEKVREKKKDRREHKTFKISSGNGRLQEASDEIILHLGNMSHDLTALEQNQTFFASTELFTVSISPKKIKFKEMTVR